MLPGYLEVVHPFRPRPTRSRVYSFTEVDLSAHLPTCLLTLQVLQLLDRGLPKNGDNRFFADAFRGVHLARDPKLRQEDYAEVAVQGVESRWFETRCPAAVQSGLPRADALRR